MKRPLSLLVLMSALALGAAPAKSDDDTFQTYRALKLEVSLDAAKAALAACRKEGYQVAVAVVDRTGVIQVALRDVFAGLHTVDTARRKAWTAVSFRTDTADLAGMAEKGEAWAIRNVTNALPLGGGVRIVAGDGDMVGAIGVSGAPGGAADAACAKAGIAAIEDKISF